MSAFQNGDAVDGGVLSEQETALVLRHGDFRRLLDLARAGFTAHLPNEFRDLEKSRRTDRMAARAQAAARVNRLTALQGRDVVVDQPRALARAAQAKPLV